MLINVMRFLCSILFIFLYLTPNSYSNADFNNWLINYKKYAVNQGISKKTVDQAFQNTKLLKRIIQYDRNQPEFIEKTNVYIGKRVNKQKVIYAKKLIRNNSNLLNKVEKKLYCEEDS